MTRFLISFAVIASVAISQQGPNVPAQKEAMQKLAYLVGDWTGDATVMAQSGPVKVRQTEHVEYKLDGLLMIMEGTGRNETGEIKFRAFATIAYDDGAKAYRFRSYNDGRYLDTELKVTDNGFAWGYDAGPAKVRFTMHLTAKGEWAETGEMTLGNAAPRKILDMTVRK